jgi:hypothetical protein
VILFQMRSASSGDGDGDYYCLVVLAAGINSRLGKWYVREGKVKDVASAVCWLLWHANVVHRGAGGPSS